MTLRAVQISIAGLAVVSIAAVKLPDPSTQQPAAQDNVSRTVWEGVYTEEQAKRGQSIYLDECARCHSEALAGGDFGPPLIGDEFLAVWNGQMVGDLFERIRLSMPQDSPGRLSRQQYVDVLAYLFQANQFPAGQEPLKADFVAPIKIEAKKGGHQ